jgi:hypothetical protein
MPQRQQQSPVQNWNKIDIPRLAPSLQCSLHSSSGDGVRDVEGRTGVSYGLTKEEREEERQDRERERGDRKMWRAGIRGVVEGGY